MITISKMREHIARAIWDDSKDAAATSVSWPGLPTHTKERYMAKADRVINDMMSDGTMPITERRLYDPTEDQRRG